MTADTIMALSPHRWIHQSLLDRATGFLLDAQQPDGTFERSWSLSESNAMFRALYALRSEYDHNPARHQRRLLPAISAMQRRLLVTANDDGGWGQTPDAPSDPMSTSYTLMALVHDHRHSTAVRNGTRYLLARQNPDGGFTSVSDQAAPRPLRYSVPVLANIFVLLAMTYLDPDFRIGGARPSERSLTSTGKG